MNNDTSDETQGYMPTDTYGLAELICDIAVDYDGYKTVEGLKSLIDEMAEYAHKIMSNEKKE